MKEPDVNNYPDNNRQGAQNQLPRTASANRQGTVRQNSPRPNAPMQNGAGQTPGYPQNPQNYPQARPTNQQSRPANPQTGYPQNGYPRQNPQNQTGYAGAYTPGQRQPQQQPGQPQPQQGRAYSYNRPASATGAAYGSEHAAGSAAGRRQRDAMVNRQAVLNQKREPVKRVKKPFRFNWGVAVFLLLCAVVIGVSVWQIQKAGWNETGIAAPSGPVVNAEPGTSGNGLPDAPTAGETGTPEDSEPAGAVQNTDDPDPADPEPTSEPTPDDGALAPDTPAEDENAVNLTLYDTVTVPNSSLNVGNLILVNASHGYSAGDAFAEQDQLRNAYRDRTGRLKVAATDIGLLPVAFDALERMVIDLEEDTGSHDLLITSGHRTVAEQQEVWDYYLNQNGEEYTNAYVAKPGYSEHNTGLACDVSFYTDEGASIPVASYEHGWWLGENCMREGFIRRYPEDKVEITGISNEPWHFRYVGIPHAWVCAKRNWCLEEYIEGVKAYSSDGIMLYVTSDGSVSEVDVRDGLPTSGGWLVYYVPKGSVGGQTEIRVPRGSDYEISGNNADGFIVTIDLR